MTEKDLDKKRRELAAEYYKLGSMKEFTADSIMMLSGFTGYKKNPGKKKASCREQK